jgi:predicted ATPase with chaperone activity
MRSTVRSAVIVGVESVPVTVDVDVHDASTDSFRIIGLTETRAKEAQIRVRSALNAIGFSIPDGKTTVTVDVFPLASVTSGLDLAIIELNA